MRGGFGEIKNRKRGKKLHLSGEVVPIEQFWNQFIDDLRRLAAIGSCMSIDKLPFWEAAGFFVSKINVKQDEKVITDPGMCPQVQGGVILPELSFLSPAAPNAACAGT